MDFYFFLFGLLSCLCVGGGVIRVMLGFLIGIGKLCGSCFRFVCELNCDY